ncbi:MAG: ferritin [Synergistaceae bacterium]|nr:ferritin [Synergistaceae bacterium]
MMIGKKMEESINSQIQAEFDSSYLYLSMAAWFENQDLPGCSHWMKKQAEEESKHGMKFYEYLVSRGGRVVLKAISAPKSEWESATNVFADVLAHEEKVTSLIYKMAELAEKEKDYATMSMLNWFIDEQVEEEENARAILNKLHKLGEIPISLSMLDRELGMRA